MLNVKTKEQSEIVEPVSITLACNDRLCQPTYRPWPDDMVIVTNTRRDRFVGTSLDRNHKGIDAEVVNSRLCAN